MRNLTECVFESFNGDFLTESNNQPKYNRVEADMKIEDLKKKIEKLMKKKGTFANNGAWNNFYDKNIIPLHNEIISISRDINTDNLKN